MKKLLCLLIGHREIPVVMVDLLARPGGILPRIDGIAVFAPHPDGNHRACIRCREVRCLHG